MLQITYIGHATTLIEMDGVRLLTDPILRRRLMHLRRMPMADIDPAWRTNLDGVLLSHLHWDHLDWPSLNQLDRATPMYVPLGTGSQFAKKDFTQVHEMRVGDEVVIGAVNVTAVYADHDGSRYRFDKGVDCLGYVVNGRCSVYFAGDTDVFPEMAGLVDDLDVALLPVWGWGPTLGAGHMDPERAAEAVQLLSPKVAIPIHWGTFHPIGFNILMPRFLREPPRAFAQFVAKMAPTTAVAIVPPGEQYTWIPDD